MQQPQRRRAIRFVTLKLFRVIPPDNSSPHSSSEDQILTSTRSNEDDGERREQLRTDTEEWWSGTISLIHPPTFSSVGSESTVQWQLNLSAEDVVKVFIIFLAIFQLSDI